MDLPLDFTRAALTTAAALATGSYLNAKLSIGNDLRQLRYDRTWLKRLIGRIEELGDTVSAYRMFERVEEGIEFLWFEGRMWTYGELKTEIHKLAAFLEAEGVKKGDYVAVFMTNSPEMVITILALSKLGAIAALINTSLRDATLKHCLDVSTSRTMISTPNLAEFVDDPIQHFSVNIGSFPPGSEVQVKGALLVDLASLPVPQVVTPPAKATLQEIAVLVYTSGTTGKPKACAIRNHRMVVTSTPLTQDLDDVKKYFPLRTYSPLPLFHGTALFTALSYTIGTSSTVCLARRFSTSHFWKDVVDSRATRILYVGELCRYLVHSPPTPYDRGHQCIVAAGNGLRPEIWDAFKDRFGVAEIREFYRSTEGQAQYDNFNGGAQGAGKVGFAGPLRRYLEKDTIIVLYDTQTEKPYRDPRTGFCVRAKIGQAGEAIGRVKSRDLLTEYLNNSSATEEKIITDVFEKGDCFQTTGDLVIQEASGWVRFHDRMGDTYRWKGENVSAGEVREHLAKQDGVLDAVVYGIKLASYDGQAGAAAITLDSRNVSTFMGGLYSGLKKTGLPAYALPRLVRITPEIEANATFKKSKGDMVKKTWIADDASNSQDKLYWLNGTSYERLDASSWGGIASGKAKL